MTVSSGSVIIKKDQSNLIGISIGGGAPYCPCLYIVQVNDPINAHSATNRNILLNCQFARESNEFIVNIFVFKRFDSGI